MALQSNSVTIKISPAALKQLDAVAKSNHCCRGKAIKDALLFQYGINSYPPRNKTAGKKR